MNTINKNYFPQFGKNLSEIIKSLGMSQADLALRAGITPAAVCLIIKGKRDPNLSTIVKILRVTEVTFERLIQ